MSEEYYKKLEELRRKNEWFVEATVVRREEPSSGKNGDKAIIDRHGELTGWIGGGCVKGIILKESEEALRSGKSGLVRVGKFAASANQSGVKEYKMTCMSEGTVEIFIDPVLPPLHIVVMGKSLIAKALVKLAKAAGYFVSAVAQDADLKTFEKPDRLITQLSLKDVPVTFTTAIVVVTQGENDEKALALLLSQECFYKGFVASRKKFSALKESMLQQNFRQALIDAVHSPSGIDINAKQPEEVAISILAEIIQHKNSLQETGFTHFDKMTGSDTSSPDYYINPVCGIPVDRNNPKHIVEYNNEKVYFCCDGCKKQFEAEPEKYMKARSEGIFLGMAAQ